MFPSFLKRGALSRLSLPHPPVLLSSQQAAPSNSLTPAPVRMTHPCWSDLYAVWKLLSSHILGTYD